MLVQHGEDFTVSELDPMQCDRSRISRQLELKCHVVSSGCWELGEHACEHAANIVVTKCEHGIVET